MNNKFQQLVDEAKAGGPRSLRAAARLMSIMTDEPQRLAEMLAGSRTWPQPRLVLGITGAPGSGKSSLVDALAAEFRRRDPHRRLGIVAVDPSSPFTGGALLGDRVRMMRHALDPGVFIRSLASRGQLGGLALGVKGVVRVMGLIGCDVVLVETVGVGQSEIEIAKSADLTAVVLAPGQGDSIQMLKAGLIEAGDLFVVNKADRPDAVRLHQDLLGALGLGTRVPATCHHQEAAASLLVEDTATTAGKPRHRDDKPVFLCSSADGRGIEGFVDALERLADREACAWQALRSRQAADEVRQAVLMEVGRRLESLLDADGVAHACVGRVLDGDLSIAETADELLRQALRQSLRRQIDERQTASLNRVATVLAASAN